MLRRHAVGAGDHSAEGGYRRAVRGGVADVDQASAAIQHHLPLLRPREGLAGSRERQWEAR